MSLIHYQLANENDIRLARVLFRDRGPAPAIARQLASRMHGQIVSILPDTNKGPYWWKVRVEVRPRTGRRRVEVRELSFKILPNPRQLGL